MNQAISHSNLLGTPGGRRRRILRLPDVMSRTGLGKTSIYEKARKESPAYDPDFPARITITKRMVGWYEDEVDEWVNSRPLTCAIN